MLTRLHFCRKLPFFQEYILASYGNQSRTSAHAAVSFHDERNEFQEAIHSRKRSFKMPQAGPFVAAVVISGILLGVSIHKVEEGMTLALFERVLNYFQ